MERAAGPDNSGHACLTTLITINLLHERANILLHNISMSQNHFLIERLLGLINVVLERRLGQLRRVGYLLLLFVAD